MARNTIQLDHNWSLKQRNVDLESLLEETALPLHDDMKKGWTPALTFPSEVHIELLKRGKIPDPYVAFNEHAVQWIGDVEWLYKCSFILEPNLGRFAFLEFEGLDTICDIYLDDEKILETNNMFRTYTHTLTIEDHAVPRSLCLLLHFKSAKAVAKAEEAKFGKVRAGSVNLGDPSRVYVRKAQYDWRWDWGPELMTCGPYRPITLTSYTQRIKDLHPRALVTFDNFGSALASLKIDASLDGHADFSGLSLSYTLKDTNDNVIVQEDHRNLQLGESLTDIIEWTDLGSKGVELWWPVGNGKQTMYTLTVNLLNQNGQIIDTITRHIGFRSARLVQEPLVEADQYGTGTTFVFEINGVRIFIGGSNWIPADNFLTTVTEERYRAWLTLLRDGNQNMIRLWGGGVYEPNIFYDICDELGILVWQDFQFSCGVYPAHDEFVDNVKVEAEQNVKRLRHHPSIVLFCGNNEDYQQVLQWGGIGELPARKIYEHVLPEVVTKLTDPPIPYHRGSPYGGQGWDTSDPTVGDIHQWNVWAGKELAYQEYDKLGGRFVSEFGMPSMPSMRTIQYWMDNGDKTDLYAQSPFMAQHTRAGSYERRFAIVMNDNFRLTEDFQTHVFNTQIMQAEAVGFAYQSWKRQWRGKGKEYNAGVIVWQLNDCWPVTSWAIADYFLRAKPVYYTIARHLAPFAVEILRKVTKNRVNDRPQQYYEFGAFQSTEAKLEIWATNSTLNARSVVLELSFFDLASSEWSHTEKQNAVLLPNQTTELRSMLCPGPPRNAQIFAHPTSTVVAHARLLDAKTDEIIARYSDWPQPYRYLKFPNPGLEIKVLEDESGITKLVVSVERPLKGLFISVIEGEEVKWSDNNLDIVPGDIQTILGKGLGNRKIESIYLGR